MSSLRPPKRDFRRRSRDEEGEHADVTGAVDHAPAYLAEDEGGS